MTNKSKSWQVKVYIGKVRAAEFTSIVEPELVETRTQNYIKIKNESTVYLRVSDDSFGWKEVENTV